MTWFRSTSPLLVLTALLLLVIGLALAGPGLYLLALGGTWYYAAAGLLTLVSAGLIGAGRRSGLWVYALMLLMTVIWAVSRVGLDGWRLLPPIAFPAGIGLWVFGPWVAGRLSSATRRTSLNATVYAGMGGCLLLFALMFTFGWTITASRYTQISPFPERMIAHDAVGAEAEQKDDWQFYGGAPSGQRFSPLTQITARNAASLEPVWSFHTGDMPLPGENTRGREFSFEATPIKIGDKLFFCTPHRDVVALDATTGKQIWKYRAQGNMSKNTYQACRGVSYYDASASVEAGAPCVHRVISTVSGSPPTLIALDAETGRLCPGFGQNGVVDLQQNMGPMPPGFHFITSPPIVMNDRIMLSGWVFDNQTVDEPSGVIRAFDARTGALSWAWDLGHTPANRPLKPDEVFTRGTPNGWGVYTADPALNLVYVPLGIATPDYFGGKRRDFDDRFGSSLVALDMTTGEEKWHFHTTHHDLWDFDIPVGPSLIDLPDSQGNTVPALVQTTKQGELFVLDRRTGKPFYRVEEKNVPQGNIPGERYAPTQPFSVDMPNLRTHPLDTDWLWGATPFDQMACKIQFHKLRYDGLYTPPSLEGSIGFPAFDGVADWYGASVDPQTGVLYVNTTFIPFLMKLVPQGKALREGLYKPWKGWGHRYPEPDFIYNPQHGLPYGAIIKSWLGIFGAPCIAPPWGETQAIDLVTRKVIWHRPIGTTKNVGHTGEPRMPIGLPTGIFSMGGTVNTASRLIFMGATADQGFRVIDGRNGKILYEREMNAGANATPLTYMGRDGRQYIVIAVGGHGGLQTRNGDEVVAFALPEHQGAQP